MTITDLGQSRTSVVRGIYPVVQNFLLACKNEGLGCVLTALLWFEELAVKKLLGIPGIGILARIFHWVILSLVALVLLFAKALMKWVVLINGIIKFRSASLFFDQSLIGISAQITPDVLRKMFGSLINPAKVANCFEYSFQTSLR